MLCPSKASEAKKRKPENRRWHRTEFSKVSKQTLTSKLYTYMTTKAYQEAVLAQINGNKEHGWGQADSLAVIKAIVKDATGKELAGEAEAQVKSLINPSQFRQILEDQKVLNESPKGSKRVKAAFTQFNVEAVAKK